MLVGAKSTGQFGFAAVYKTTFSSLSFLACSPFYFLISSLIYIHIISSLFSFELSHHPFLPLSSCFIFSFFFLQFCPARQQLYISFPPFVFSFSPISVLRFFPRAKDISPASPPLPSLISYCFSYIDSHAT